MNSEAEMLTAIRVWLECPVDKRPSPAALGQRIAEIAGTTVTERSARLGIEAFCGLNDIWPGDPYPPICMENSFAIEARDSLASEETRK